MTTRRATLAWTLLIALLAIPFGGGCLDGSRRANNTTFWSQGRLFAVDWTRGLGREELWVLERFEFSSPVASEERGLIFVGTSDGRVLCVDARTGRTRWTRQLSEGVEGSVTLGGDRLFVGGLDGVLRALDPISGREIWTFDSKGSIQAPVAIDEEAGRVVLGNALNQIFALDLETGEFLWRKERKVKNDFTIYGHGTPLVRDGRVYIGFSDGQIMAYALEDGATIWGRDLSRGEERFRDVDARPFAHDGVLYAASFAGGLFALDLETGKQIWHLDVEGASELQHDDGILYFTSLGYVHALDMASGTMRWYYEILGEDVLSRPVLGDRFIFVGMRHSGLLVLERSTGRLVTVSDSGSGFSAAPSLVDDRLFAFSNAGTLFALQIYDE